MKNDVFAFNVGEVSNLADVRRASIKTAYRLFCEKNDDTPLFHQPFFLDAACGGAENWSAIVAEKNGQPVGIWPFFLKKKWGAAYVAMPNLCRLMGPFFAKEVRGQEAGLLKEMIAELPKLAAFEQDFHYQTQNWLPFFWEKFRQTTRYSYQISTENGLENAWQKLAPDYRNNKIKRAGQLVKLRTDGPLDDFWRIQNMSFARQNQQPPVGFPFLKNLDGALAANGSRGIFFAEDAAGNIHSAAYLVWDKKTAYLLMAGDDPDFRQSGAGIWLIWELIKFAHNSLKINEFDFLGSMVPGIERVRRNFGAEQRGYFRIQKEWSVLWKIGKFLWR